jgi:putative ubiquitin-RnfH superfamily antitoxin RatB of RatAB toxin-antitoxin module
LGIGWNFIVITEIEDDEDSEYEWILKFARKNKELGITFFDDLPLTNMKAGDFLTEIINDRSINTRDEIKLYRQIYELSKTAVTYEREGVEPTAQAQAVIDETLEQAAVSRQAAAIALVKQQERDRAYEAMINDPKRIARIKAETEQLMIDAGEKNS